MRLSFRCLTFQVSHLTPNEQPFKFHIKCAFLNIDHFAGVSILCSLTTAFVLPDTVSRISICCVDVIWHCMWNVCHFPSAEHHWPIVEALRGTTCRIIDDYIRTRCLSCLCFTCCTFFSQGNVSLIVIYYCSVAVVTVDGSQFWI